MGSGTFDAGKYRAFSNSTKGKTTDQIYTGRGLNPKLDPKGAFRESRDSVDNPLSTPVIVALDVTGSMGVIADNIAREGLGVLFNGILDKKPITDPHLMFMGVGDVKFDRAPLQVSQFEADARVIEQLTQLWLEHGGGGNDSEGYNLPWYFASQFTAHDAFEKRGKKGFLFTVGDEQCPPSLDQGDLKRVFGKGEPMTNEFLLEQTRQKYEVFHVVIEQGDYARHSLNRVKDSWYKVLGERTLYLPDYTKLAEVIVSVMEMTAGATAEQSASAWGSDATLIHRVVKGLLPSPAGTTARPMLGGPRS